LYAGLYGQVKFTLQQDTINFTIPTTAVIIRTGFPHVASVDENELIRLHRVQIGRDYGNQMEITSGLTEDKRIVILPSDAIREGVKVVIDAKSVK
jgi:multidrug efflux pump subunit AcrA (membrane-fusion protein)